MNTIRRLACLAALTLVCSAITNAEDIYKWTDENGNVHYGDRPSGAASEERLQISYNRTRSSDVQRRVQSYRDANAEREKARDEAAAAEQTAAEERAKADERMAKCEDTRAKMKQMLEARRVYRENEAGERVYLDEAARAEARSKAEELIEEYCS